MTSLNIERPTNRRTASQTRMACANNRAKSESSTAGGLPFGSSCENFWRIFYASVRMCHISRTHPKNKTCLRAEVEVAARAAAARAGPEMAADQLL